MYSEEKVSIGSGSGGSGREFKEALRYYERAALIDSSSGNAQNQVSF